MVPLYRAEVRVELKPGVADPEGANTKKALELLGFQGIRNVKSVHAFALDLDAKSEADARKQVEEMCKRLLVNPVIHVPRITLTNGNGAAPARAPAKAATKKAAKKAPAARKPAAPARKATAKKGAPTGAKKAAKKAAKPAKPTKPVKPAKAGKTAKRSR